MRSAGQAESQQPTRRRSKRSRAQYSGTVRGDAGTIQGTLVITCFERNEAWPLAASTRDGNAEKKSCIGRDSDDLDIGQR